MFPENAVEEINEYGSYGEARGDEWAKRDICYSLRGGEGMISSLPQMPFPQVGNI